MLVLSRKSGEEILIGDDVRLVVNRISGGRVKIAIAAPKNVRVVRGELGDKVFVAKLFGRAIGLDVVPVDALCAIVHSLGVPLGLKGGDRVEAPVSINAKLGVQQPFGDGMLSQRVPRSLILCWHL